MQGCTLSPCIELPLITDDSPALSQRYRRGCPGKVKQRKIYPQFQVLSAPLSPLGSVSGSVRSPHSLLSLTEVCFRVTEVPRSLGTPPRENVYQGAQQDA